jgi:16S rRNA (guanine1207-N2)-methyltransferase
VTPDEPDEAASPDQYFTARPRSPSMRSEQRFVYRGELLTFVLDRGVFGAHGLDPGTALLIEHLTVGRADQVLDLGCGWGAVGVAAARSAPEGHVILTDVNRRAARLARLNVDSNRATNAEVRVGDLFAPVPGERFDLIATNPPYRAGRPLILRLLAEAPDHLRPDGRLLLVGKGTQGILYYQGVLESRWPGPVAVLGRRSGYRVLEARLDPVRRNP